MLKNAFAKKLISKMVEEGSQLAVTYSELTIETLEKGVKCVHC